MTANAPRVYLDANVFITAFENPGARSDHAWIVIDAIERGDIIGATSELTLAEVLVKPLGLGDTTLAQGYEAMISPAPGFEVLPISREILREAAKIRAREPAIRLPDAIHVASARKLSCSAMVSDDRRLPECGFKTLSLSPFTLDDILGTSE